jgi:hypothetical protein
MAAGLEKEIKTKLDDTVSMMLQGAAADYTAYASAVARYRVLKELQDFIDERNDALNKGEVVDED